MLLVLYDWQKNQLLMLFCGAVLLYSITKSKTFHGRGVLVKRSYLDQKQVLLSSLLPNLVNSSFANILHEQRLININNLVTLIN